MRKERRRTLINSDVAGHKVPLVMLGIKDKNKSKTVNKMAVRTYISIITLNANGLNAPT